ncbi:MAG: hypothetical protein ABI165_00730 [Bryobacteraceae bacterium]
MPFCVKCGSPVQHYDQFCEKCGSRQTPASAAPASAPEFLSGISGRSASLLCYIPFVGWLAAIVVLASARFRHDPRVRFNAFQGLYLFVAWLLVDLVVAPLFAFSFLIPGFGLHHLVPSLLRTIIFGAWIFMIVKVSQDENVRLPILGELADRSVAEQR